MRFSLLSILLILISGLLYAQPPAFKLNSGNQLSGIDTPCTNMDFEECSFNGWELFKGTAIGDTSFSYANDTSISPGIQHFITNGGYDSVVIAANPPGMIPRKFGNGSCSVLLGDNTGTGANASKLKQTFYVDSSNTILTFHYAAVLQDPSHPPKDQPYFTVKIYDSTDTAIPCGQYNIITGPVGSGGDPDFIATTYNGESLFYKDWTTEFVNLENYSGQNLTVEYIAADCAQGGHFGYVYLDGACAMGTQQDGITASFPSGCGNFPVILNGMRGVKNYLWNTGDTTPGISVNTNGVFSVTVTGSSGCSNSYSVNFQNNITADANFSYDNSCAGIPVNFSDLSSVTGGVITGWQWNFGDSSGISFQQNPQHSYDSSGTYNVTLTITTNSGCSEDTSITLVMNEPEYNLISAPDSVCINDDEIFFTASDSGGTWSGDGITDSINGIFDPSMAGAGEHIISYFISGICLDTGIHHIIVNDNPSLVIDSVDHVSCFDGNDGAFFTSGSGGTSPYTYYWGNGCLSCNPFILYAGTYLYIISDSKGCLDSGEIIITQPDSLQISIFGPSVILCEGESTVLSVNVTGGIYPYSYFWTTGDTTPSIIAIASQLYKVTVTDVNECSNTASASVNFFPAPAVDLGNDTAILENDNLILDAGNSGSSYLWSTGEITESITINSAGGYYVIVTDSNGCSGSDTIIVSVISSVSEKSIWKNYHIYPNPARNKLFIGKSNSSIAEFVIFNSLGEIMLKSTIKNSLLEINTFAFPGGIYYLQITDEKMSAVCKIFFDNQ